MVVVVVVVVVAGYSGTGYRWHGDIEGTQRKGPGHRVRLLWGWGSGGRGGRVHQASPPGREGDEAKDVYIRRIKV